MSGIIAAGLARDEGVDAMGDSDPAYQYGSGIGEDELARLEAQGAAMAAATRMIFAHAGIRPGMRVLDLGCGAGDVSFVAADLVEPAARWSASTAPRGHWPGLGCGQDNAAWATCGSWRATCWIQRPAGLSTRSSSDWS